MFTDICLSQRELVYLGCNMLEDLTRVPYDSVLALAVDHVCTMREEPNTHLALAAIFDVLLSIVDVYGDTLTSQDLKAIAATCVLTSQSLGGELDAA